MVLLVLNEADVDASPGTEDPPGTDRPAGTAGTDSPAGTDGPAVLAGHPSLHRHRERSGKEGQVLHRSKRGWVWNQFFVIEEYTGPDPVLVGRVRLSAVCVCVCVCVGVCVSACVCVLIFTQSDF